MKEGGGFFVQGRYSVARERFAAAHQLAIASSRNDLAGRAMSNIGGCQYALHSYQPALHSFLDARRLADAEADANTVAVLDANIASLYAQMGEVDAAVQWLQGTLTQIGSKTGYFRSKMEIEMGALLARQELLSDKPERLPLDQMQQAELMFQRGIDGAAKDRDLATYALGWNRLGEELLRRKELPGAERALLEAYRVRKLNHLPLDSSYWNLGELRLAQGDLPSASALLDRAVELSENAQGTMPQWHVFDARGRVRMEQGRLSEALDDFRIAVRLARTERWSAPAAEATRIGAEGMLDQVHSDLIEAGNRLYIETRDPALIRETFDAAEENRANSLRQIVQGRHSATADLPPEYWELLTRLQRAEVTAIRSSDPAAQQAVSTARAEIVRIEASVLPDSLPLPGGLLDRAQRALLPDTALFSFHLGNSISWLWAMDRDSLRLYALPPRGQIESQVRRVTEAIRNNASDATRQGAELYRTLFGALAPRYQRKGQWLLALDESLLNVPFPALPERLQAHPTYIVEHHATEVIPGVGYWLEAVARHRTLETTPMFLGVGDPIYNRADPRAPSRNATVRRIFPNSLTLFAASKADGDSLALPRLVGSGPELDQCSRIWQGEHLLLKGADASRQNLLEQLRRKPAIVHIATHVLASSQRPSYGLIALSMNDRNETELLQPMEISRWKIEVGLVVLSGCHSAAGATLPGSGLMGLTRAWLIAGAQSVVASHWDTPDQEGDIFRAFYASLRAQPHPDPRQALRTAQLEMIRGGSWRAESRYWGTYFVVGD
ncbi:MAG TPA: CHAT domain-containing tetratricopeptide repeat protein [Bryobacteraceae bacterium]|nr:CHAT domain-containing tetratricopeptide repeat protein [Bryobacteraceae bacterium]